MIKTCRDCHGCSVDYSEANLKRCAGCRKVYYCSSACQKYDWVRHIFDCKPRRPINTADYLALAVRQRLTPDRLQTCEVYGFHPVCANEELWKLLSLYTGLIKYMGIPPKTIHDWHVRGVLVDEIKAAYNHPKYSKSVCFHWFLQNEYVIAQAGQPLSNETVLGHAHSAPVRAWRFTGGSEHDSLEKIKTAIARKSAEERACHFLYLLLVAKECPSPDVDLWVDFGFVSCTSPEEAAELGSWYYRLINKCTFQEFYDAYCTRRLLDLFVSKGVKMKPSEGLQDLLRGNRTKSVWYLKQYIQLDESICEEFDIPVSVKLDYGFVNCRNDSERRQLKRVYKAFFDRHEGDPLALHEAAFRGNIRGYLSNVVQGLRDPKFERLMSNPYILPRLYHVVKNLHFPMSESPLLNIHTSFMLTNQMLHLVGPSNVISVLQKYSALQGDVSRKLDFFMRGIPSCKTFHV